MKKLLVVLLIMASLGGNAQSFAPYVGVGANRVGSDMSYGGEVGIYNSKTWWALGFSAMGATEYGAVKYYRKLHNAGKMDVFFSSAASVSLDSETELSIEPGFAFVFNLWPKFAPQLSFSTPVSMKTGNLYPSLGLGLNYWIK